MITIEELNTSSVAVTAKLKGLRWGLRKATAKDIEETIYDDITSYFTSINKVLISVEIEEYEDERTLSTCLLFNLHMYISFDENKVDYDDLHVIENYLLKNFIKEF